MLACFRFSLSTFVLLLSHIFSFLYAINHIQHCYYFYLNSSLSLKEIILNIRKVLIYLPMWLPFAVLFFPFHRSQFPLTFIFLLLEGLHVTFLVSQVCWRWILSALACRRVSLFSVCFIDIRYFFQFPLISVLNLYIFSSFFLLWVYFAVLFLVY